MRNRKLSLYDENNLIVDGLDYFPSRKELLIEDLCDEIDYWKEEALKYKELYKESQQKRNEEMKESLEHSQKMAGLMLKGLLNQDSVLHDWVDKTHHLENIEENT